MAKYCYKCGLALREGARFCHSCGTAVRTPQPDSPADTSAASPASAIDSARPSLVERMKKRVKEARKDGVSRIDDYLASLETRNEVSGVRLTEGRREFLRKRLTGLRGRLSEGEEGIAQEEWQVLSVALESLPEDLIDEKCVICFKPISEESERALAFCPHCIRGGHQEHLAEWIKIKGTCPICRQSVKTSELVKYQAPSAIE
ncbi:MAG: RING finger domain-containing protein [Candidatus Thorarchaeota archaeon]